MKQQYKVLAMSAPSMGLSMPAFGATWKIDTSHSYAYFQVKHMMVSNVRGQMGGLEGTIELDEATPTKSKVSATLDPSTINTNHAKRDEHLKSPDFFNVAKCSKITFSSSKVTGAIGALKVAGALTMNCVTKDVVLAIEGPTPPVKGMSGDHRRGFTGTTKINRKDCNLIWNKTLDGGGLLVSDEVQVTLEIEATDNLKSSH